MDSIFTKRTEIERKTEEVSELGLAGLHAVKDSYCDKDSGALQFKSEDIIPIA